MSTTEQEITVEDELWQIEDRTQEDGTVRGECLGWEKVEPRRNGPKAAVRIRLPNGQRFTEEMEWPASADPDQYEFVRLVEHCGYSLSAALDLEDEFVPCRRGEDGEWSIDIPQSTRADVRDSVVEAVRMAGYPLILLHRYKRVIDEDPYTTDPVEYVFISAALILAWVVAALVGLLIVSGILTVLGVA